MDKALDAVDWHDLFLLKPNADELTGKHLHSSAGFSQDLLYQHQELFYQLLLKCFEAMATTTTTTGGRRVSQLYATQTADLIMKFALQRKWNNFTLDVLNCWCGVERADLFFQHLLRAIVNVLAGGGSGSAIDGECIAAVLALLQSFITATDTLNMNGLLSFFVQDPALFNPLMEVVLSADGHDNCTAAFVVLLLLARYSGGNHMNSNQIRFRLSAVGNVDTFKKWEMLILRQFQLSGSGTVAAPAPGMVNFVYSLLSPPVTYNSRSITTPVFHIYHAWLILNSLLVYNDAFCTHWCSNNDLTTLMPYFVEEFACGDSDTCKVCVHIISVLAKKSSLNLQVATSHELLIKYHFTPYQKQIIASFDCRAPLLSLLAIYVGMNNKKSHAPIVAFAFATILAVIRRCKHEKVRMDTNWEFVYKTVINACKYFDNMEHVTERGLAILDFVLCFGDCLLCDTQSYDSLFYQIILNHEFFETRSVDSRNLKAICSQFMAQYAQELETPEMVIASIHRFYEEIELDLKGKYDYQGDIDISEFIRNILRNWSSPSFVTSQ